MLYGWVSGGERQTDDDAWKESLYYFGDEDDGAMSLGWRQISIVDDEYEDLQPGDGILGRGSGPLVLFPDFRQEGCRGF